MTRQLSADFAETDIYNSTVQFNCTVLSFYIREGGEIWMQVTSNENNFGQLKGENR